MRKKAFAVVSGFAIVLSIACFVHADSNIRLFVEGREVILDRSSVTVGGRVLVPLRGIFEQLGAVLTWEDPVTHAIIVSRDVIQGRGPQIRLALGSRQAFINDQPVMLDVPPSVIGGRTLVPLRFVSEALGARVVWDPGARIVRITSPPPQPSTPPDVTRMTPPKGGLEEGTVVAVDLTAVPQQIVLMRNPNYTGAYTIASDTVFTRRDLNTSPNRVESIQPQQIFPGDAMSLVVEVGGGPRPLGTIRRGEVMVREMRGLVQTIAGRTLTLSDGRSFSLAEQVRFTAKGRIASRQDALGKQVILRIQPLTREVTEVEIV